MATLQGTMPYQVREMLRKEYYVAGNTYNIALVTSAVSPFGIDGNTPVRLFGSLNEISGGGYAAQALYSGATDFPDLSTDDDRLLPTIITRVIFWVASGTPIPSSSDPSLQIAYAVLTDNNVSIPDRIILAAKSFTPRQAPVGASISLDLEIGINTSY